MSLPIGTRLGAYEVQSLLGAGGMGEVYKALDTRLERIVAIKVLPSEVAGDPDFRQRFEREAKAISSLNHPHICTLHDVGCQQPSGGSGPAIDFLVMEYVEGETLAERLAKGPLPVRQLLRYAVEIAEALDRAHRQGITHRDLKPGNIMLTRTGTKLLDFGLAKLKPAAPVDLSSRMVTDSGGLTARGTILGTLQYMAPEQLEGKPVDHRADIFAFGAVVYEMATGRRAFEGESQASLIGAILRDDPPPVSTRQPMVPAALDGLVMTCLAKDPDDRWQSAGDLGRQLRLIQDSSPASTVSMPAAAATVTPTAPRAALRQWMTLAAGVLVVVAMAGVAVWYFARSGPAATPAPVSRFLVTPPATAPLAALPGFDLAVSPDGTKLAYIGQKENGGLTLYLRELDALDAQPIPGVEAAEGIGGNPFFSADGSSVGFESPQGIMRASLGGGPPILILQRQPPMFGAAWASDGRVIFAASDGDFSSLQQVMAGGGGTPERLMPEGEATRFRGGPVLLPDERHVLFTSFEEARANRPQVAVLDVQTHEERTLIEYGRDPYYVASGYLVFSRGTTVMAVPFDANRLAVTGDPVAMVQDVRRPSGVPEGYGATDYAVSRTGTLVYVPGRGQQSSVGTLVWVDRSGRAVGRAVSEPVENPRDPRISPDGRQVVLTTGPINGGDLWIYDLGGRPSIPLMVGQGDSRLAVWSPDGRNVAFATDGLDASIGLVGSSLFRMPADGSVREPQPLRADLQTAAPAAWSAGELLLNNLTDNTNPDLIAISVDGESGVRTVVASEDREGDGALSSDGRWLAYASNRTGRYEVWVKRYPDGVPVRVSENSGGEPVWSKDGRELFYRQGTAMMSVAVQAGKELSFKPAVQLFDEPYLNQSSFTVRSYDVAPDGRFLMIDRGGARADAQSPSIVVVQNWDQELARRVPVGR